MEQSGLVLRFEGYPCGGLETNRPKTTHVGGVPSFTHTNTQNTQVDATSPTEAAPFDPFKLVKTDSFLFAPKDARTSKQCLSTPLETPRLSTWHAVNKLGDRIFRPAIAGRMAAFRVSERAPSNVRKSSRKNRGGNVQNCLSAVRRLGPCGEQS